MRLLYITFLISIVFIITLASFKSADNDGLKATTGGEISFTVRTVTAGGNYAPKHVLAIWVEHQDEFVKTRKAMANQRKQYLYTWKAASNYNVVDAITGPTLNSHQTHTITWDCTDLDGNIVPDGEYIIYAEFTEKHAQGPLYSISFTKGPDAISISPPDETYFKDIEFEFTPVVAEFTANETEICQWGTVTFTDASVNATSWQWDFGEGAAPATANTQGPHTVYYTTPGVKNVLLTINENVTELKEEFIDVTIQPEAGYDYTAQNLSVDFINQSENAESFFWDFGDGSTSTEENPSHSYLVAGNYSVSLTASTGSCDNVSTQQISLPVVDINEISQLNQIEILPNPNKGYFKVGPVAFTQVSCVSIIDLSGKIIFPEDYFETDGRYIIFKLEGIKKGIYFIQIETDNRIIAEKFIVR